MEYLWNIVVDSGWIGRILLFFSVGIWGLFLYSFFYCVYYQKSWKNQFKLEEKNEFIWEKLVYPILLSMSWIATMGSLSTLLGLLGTVLGIQQAFQSMKESGQVGVSVFAEGVSLALTTTILGLGIAIVSQILNQILRSFLSQLEKIFFHS